MSSGKMYGCDHKSWLWWLIGFVVLVIVFCAGYRLGKWAAYFGYGDYYGYGSYQYGPMMRWGGPGYGGYGMMRGWRYYDDALPVQQAATATAPATTTTK